MSVDNQYPTVATIIGCPEELSDANGLVATPIGLTDNNAVKTDDPVRKAVLDNICGNLPAKSTLDLKKCDVCNITCNGDVSFEKHVNGAKHAKKLKEKNMEDLVDLPFIVVDTDKKMYKCTLCSTTMNARSQINGHIAGMKHKNKEQQQTNLSDENKTKTNGDGKNKSKVDLTPNLLYCATCNVHVNSKMQLDQHTASKKHINRVNGTVGKYTVRPTVNRQQRRADSQPYFVRPRGGDSGAAAATTSTTGAALLHNNSSSHSTRPYSYPHASNASAGGGGGSSSSFGGGGGGGGGGPMRRNSYYPSSSSAPFSSNSWLNQRRVQNNFHSPLQDYFHRRPANNASSFY